MGCVYLSYMAVLNMKNHVKVHIWHGVFYLGKTLVKASCRFPIKLRIGNIAYYKSLTCELY